MNVGKEREKRKGHTGKKFLLNKRAPAGILDNKKAVCAKLLNTDWFVLFFHV